VSLALGTSFVCNETAIEAATAKYTTHSVISLTIPRSSLLRKQVITLDVKQLSCGIPMEPGAGRSGDLKRLGEPIGGISYVSGTPVQDFFVPSV